jgi:UDP-glucose 4-epimerase
MKTILITGGAGYIGSHACVEFLNAGYDIVVLDNLCNSSATSLDRVRELTGLDFPFVEGDIRDRAALDKLFRDHDIDAVIHFAGLKSVGESVEKPLFYYDNNIAGSVTLFEAMQAAGVKTVVFSSSATVYGDPAFVPIREDFPVGATTNPYGTSKLFIEKILQDVAVSDPGWSIALLMILVTGGAGFIGANFVWTG